VCRALILSQIQKQIKKVAIKTIDQFKYCDRKDDGILLLFLLLLLLLLPHLLNTKPVKTNIFVGPNLTASKHCMSRGDFG